MSFCYPYDLSGIFNRFVTAHAGDHKFRCACAEPLLTRLVSEDHPLQAPSPPWYVLRDVRDALTGARLTSPLYVLQPEVNETVASIAYSDEWRALEEHLGEVDKL